MAAVTASTLILAGLAAGAVGAGGAVAASELSRPDEPKIPRRKKEPRSIAEQEALARRRQAQKAGAAFGRSDMIMTGPGGLGSLGPGGTPGAALSGALLGG